MNTTKRPRARQRRRETCADWLERIEPEEFQRRWPRTGAQGFYEHERLWIARCCAHEGVRQMAQDHLRQNEWRRQKREARQFAEDLMGGGPLSDSLAGVRSLLAFLLGVEVEWAEDE